MSEAHTVDDFATDRNPVLGDPHRPGDVTLSKLPSEQTSAKPRRRGRPKRADAPKIPWPTIDAGLVHGERYVDPTTGHEVLRYPSLAVLAERHGVSRTLVWKFARRHHCFDRRKEAQARTLARTDEKVIEKVSSARATHTIDVLGVVDQFLARFEQDLRDGKVRTDSAADFDRLTRLREFVTGGADSRQELTGSISLAAIQARHQHLRTQAGQLPAELAGVVADSAGDELVRAPQGSGEPA